MKRDVAALREELNGLKAANLSSDSSAELLQVKEQLEDIRQYTRDRNLIIDWCARNYRWKSPQLYIQIIRVQRLGMNIDPNEIEANHRLPTRNTTNRPPSIIGQVVSSSSGQLCEYFYQKEV